MNVCPEIPPLGLQLQFDARLESISRKKKVRYNVFIHFYTFNTTYQVQHKHPTPWLLSMCLGKELVDEFAPRTNSFDKQARWYLFQIDRCSCSSRSELASLVHLPRRTRVHHMRSVFQEVSLYIHCFHQSPFHKLPHKEGLEQNPSECKLGSKRSKEVCRFCQNKSYLFGRRN